jgi:hypothetical protein
VSNQNVVVLKLTNEQQEQIRGMTGKRISELRIEAFEQQAGGRITPGEPIRFDRPGGHVQ